MSNMTEQQPTEITPSSAAHLTWEPHRAPDGAYPVFGQVIGRDGYKWYPRIASVKAWGGPPYSEDPDGDYKARDEANAAFIVAAFNACAEAIGTDLKAREWLEAGGLQRHVEAVKEDLQLDGLEPPLGLATALTRYRTSVRETLP